MPVCIVFTSDPNGIKLSTTTKTADVVRELGRAARANSRSTIAALVVSAEGARKLRRVLDRRWRDRYCGGSNYAVNPAEVVQLVNYLADTYDLTCYGVARPLSRPARRTVFQRFSRGAKSEVPAAVDPDTAVMDELLAAGVVTRHQRRTGDVLFRGTERAIAIAREVAAEMVPAPGAIETPSSRPALITEVVVVPEPNMTREDLLYQLELHKDDPPGRLQQGYRYAAINLRDKIGGLASITGLTSAQKDGAAAFKTAFEHGQLGAAQAVDYERTKVDTSAVTNTVMDSGATARAEFYSARTRLGLADDEEDRKRGIEHPRLAVAERIILAEQSVRQIADAMGYSGGAGRAAVAALAKEAATILAQHFGFVSATRSRVRFDGEQPQALNEAFRTEVPVGARAEKVEKA